MYEKEMSAIAARLRNRRKALRLSLQELGDLTGISRSTLQRYETGLIRNVPLSRLSVLASALQTTAGELIGWEEAPAQASPDEVDLLLGNEIRSMTEAKKKALLQYAKFLNSQQEQSI